jgi:hypothetical protein
MGVVYLKQTSIKINNFNWDQYEKVKTYFKLVNIQISFDSSLKATYFCNGSHLGWMEMLLDIMLQIIIVMQLQFKYEL